MSRLRVHPPKQAASVIKDMTSRGFSVIGIADEFGVDKETCQKWIDDYPDLQAALESGLEIERQALHSLVVQSAVMQRPKNSNACFILRSRHGYKDESPTNISVGVQVAQNVMVVTDMGSDEEWAAKAARHQRELTMPENATPLEIAATVAPQRPVEPIAYPALQWEASEGVAVPSAQSWQAPTWLKP